MNKKLHNDWIEGEGLFNSSILCCEVEYSVDKQLKLLRIILEYLGSNNYLNESLFFLKDWHNHDGYISKEKAIDKNELENILTNPKEVLKNRDCNVYDLVYNEAKTFMIRWYYQKDDDDEVYCDFTLIVSKAAELNKVKELIRHNVIDKGLKIKNARQYFEEQYAG